MNPFTSVSRRSRLREADALLDCHGIEPNGPAGEIGIEASGCVLAPQAQAAIISLTSESFPGSLLHEVKWTGQGSVVAGQVVVGRWCRRDGGRQTIDDATISIAGLVRGEVEFAGKFDGDPANSQVVNCQAPLQDSDSAGAATRTLPPEIKGLSKIRRMGRVVGWAEQRESHQKSVIRNPFQRTADETQQEHHRRQILAAGAAAAAIAIVPRHVLGGPGQTPPSEKLNLAGVGIGGQGGWDLKTSTTRTSWPWPTSIGATRPAPSTSIQGR